MNVDDGRLVSPDLFKELQAELGAAEKAEKIFTEIPEKLEHAARRKLAGRREARVSLTSGGKLSRFAARQRRMRRERNR